MLVGGLEKEADILEVIADLSNDEVFTPPVVVRSVLDLLPAEVWTNAELRWLDPGCKTGVFLREITRRLMAGLADVLPDEAGRLEHILKNQVFGIAITELTSLISRRSLYLSKDATGHRSIITMPTSSENVWFDRVEHSYKKGRCIHCSASEKDMEKPGLDNHAYGFIHPEGRDAIGKEFKMQFDVVVGNPPYQMTGGGGGGGHSPLYDLFVDQARALNPRYMSMIIPSRWVAGGRGLGDFRASMLNDRRTRTLVDYPNSAELFPTVDIKSGVCYFLWDRDTEGDCSITLVRAGQSFGPQVRKLDEYDILIRDHRALPILHKVRQAGEDTLEPLVAGAVPFGLTSNFKGYKVGVEPGSHEVRLYASTPAGKRNEGAMNRADVTKNTHLIDYWKVLAPKAGPGSSGGHVLPDIVLGRSIIAGPPSVCTETFLPIGPFASEAEAASVDAYLRTRFCRFLISLRKISQDAMRGVYRWVPQQTWDHEWTDAELYAKYNITEDEQAYIAAMIREMG